MSGLNSQPSQRELERARDTFHHLLETSAPELSFQQLFAKSPFILSRSIPLRVESHEIRSLGRPGKSEADFIFYPSNFLPISTYGVIELKRPSTRLVTRTRSNVIILSRDAQTAVSQGQLYAKKLGRELLHRLPSTVVLGNRSFVFVIAGLSQELLQGIEDVDALVPKGCQIIPYDTLFSQFNSSLPPRVLFLVPRGYSTRRSLDDLSRQCEQSNNRFEINDDNMAFWSLLEDEWRDGNYFGTRLPGQRVINRPYWCVSGTDFLATESPAHLDFPVYVNKLRRLILESAELHRHAAELESYRSNIGQLLGAMNSDELRQLKEAVQYCRRHKVSNYFFEYPSANSDFLEHLGLISFDFADFGEAYHKLNPEIFNVLR